MPKVSKDYVEKKKKKIIEAALTVCRKKSLYELTIQDIADEIGMSRGGIYLYFSDIDDILIALVNRFNTENSFKKRVDEIINNNDSSKRAIESLFHLLGSYWKENITTIGKIIFELTVLLANNPKRQEKIISQTIELQNGQYIKAQLFQKIKEGIEIGEFKPKMPVEDIFQFIMASVDGIIKDCVLQRCYGRVMHVEFELDEIKLMNTLLKAVLMLLNVCEEEEN